MHRGTELLGRDAQCGLMIIKASNGRWVVGQPCHNSRGPDRKYLRYAGESMAVGRSIPNRVRARRVSALARDAGLYKIQLVILVKL